MFGRDVHFSRADESLAFQREPIVESIAASPEIAGAAPQSWQPDHILQDFQEFLEQLDDLNGILDIEPS